MKYSIATDMEIQSKIEDSIKEIEEKYNIKINMGDWTWEFNIPIKQLCLEIIEEKGALNYKEIYDFFKYVQKNVCELVAHIYYIEYGLEEKHTYPDYMITTMSDLIDEMNKHCDYPEAKEGFLTDLTTECASNNVNARDGFIFWSDCNGFNYFENNKQMTKHIIRWLKDTDFDLEEHAAEELYKILTREEL